MTTEKSDTLCQPQGSTLAVRYPSLDLVLTVVASVCQPQTIVDQSKSTASITSAGLSVQVVLIVVMRLPLEQKERESKWWEQ